MKDTRLFYYDDLTLLVECNMHEIQMITDIII